MAQNTRQDGAEAGRRSRSTVTPRPTSAKGPRRASSLKGARRRGTVTEFHRDAGGWGYVTADGGAGEQIYVHGADADRETRRKISAGVRVSFKVEPWGNKGGGRAVDVRLSTSSATPERVAETAKAPAPSVVAWYFSDHAAEMLAERVIAPTAVLQVLDDPGALRLPGRTKDTTRVIGQGIHALVNETTKTVVTVRHVESSHRAA